MSEPSSSRAQPNWLVGWIPWLVVGAALRAWDLPWRGLALADEGGRVLAARTIVHAGSWVIYKAIGAAADLQSYLQAFSGPLGQSLGYPPDPFWGYHVLLVIVGGPLGLPAYSSQLLSALFGSVSLYLVWRLAAQANTLGLASTAIIMLAFAPYHVLYSRIGVPQVVAGAIIMLAVIFYVGGDDPRREQWRLRMAGLAFAAALSVHVTALIHLGALVVSELAGVRWSRSTDWERLRRRARVFIPATIGPIIGIEVIAWLVLGLKQLFLPRAGWNQTFLSSYISVLFHDVTDRVHPAFLFGLEMMTDLQGVGFIAALAVGVVVSARAFRSTFHRTLLLQVVVPFLCLSVNGLQVPRAFTPLMPFAAILASIGICTAAAAIYGYWADGETKFRPAVVGAFIAVTMLGAVPALVTVVGLRSGYRAVAEYLRAGGDTRHISTQRAGTGVYLGIPASIAPPGENERGMRALLDLATKYRARYVVVDYAKEAQYPAIGALKAVCQPVWSVSNPVGNFWPLVADEYATKEWIAKAWRGDRRAYIDVYDLGSCRGAS